MRLFVFAATLFFLAPTASSPAQDLPYPSGLTSAFKPEARLPGVESAFLPPLFKSSHASNLLLLKNGDLLCFWFSGSKEGQGDVGIVVSRLPKGSRTWGKTILIDHDPAKSYQNPVPFEADNGDIWLLHSAQSAGKGQADAIVMKTVSHDGGKTWAAPQVLFSKPGSFTRQRIVRGDQGEILLPIFYSTSSGITKGADSNYSSVQVSRDQGKTWSECVVPHSEGRVQMNIVKLHAHSYVAFFRSRYADHIFRSTSTDGCHWETPVATVLPNNNASIQATVLRNGHIVITFDNTSGHKGAGVLQTGARAPLSIAVSMDGGITWPQIRDLEVSDKERRSVAEQAAGRGQDSGKDGLQSFINVLGEEEYSYPTVQQVANGKIVAAYTYRRIGIKAAEFSEGWITGGHSAGEYNPSESK